MIFKPKSKEEIYKLPEGKVILDAIRYLNSIGLRTEAPYYTDPYFRIQLKDYYLDLTYVSIKERKKQDYKYEWSLNNTKLNLIEFYKSWEEVKVKLDKIKDTYRIKNLDYMNESIFKAKTKEDVKNYVEEKFPSFYYMLFSSGLFDKYFEDIRLTSDKNVIIRIDLDNIEILIRGNIYDNKNKGNKVYIHHEDTWINFVTKEIKVSNELTEFISKWKSIDKEISKILFHWNKSRIKSTEEYLTDILKDEIQKEDLLNSLIYYIKKSNNDDPDLVNESIFQPKTEFEKGSDAYKILQYSKRLTKEFGEEFYPYENNSTYAFFAIPPKFEGLRILYAYKADVWRVGDNGISVNDLEYSDSFEELIKYMHEFIKTKERESNKFTKFLKVFNQIEDKNKSYELRSSSEYSPAYNSIRYEKYIGNTENLPYQKQIRIILYYDNQDGLRVFINHGGEFITGSPIYDIRGYYSYYKLAEDRLKFNINEGLKDVLKPRSQEEIKSNILNYIKNNKNIIFDIEFLPSGINFNNKGYVDFENLKIMPDNIEFNNGRGVDLMFLKKLHPNTKFNNGGNIMLDRLKSVPKGFEFNNGGDIFYKNYYRSAGEMNEFIKKENLINEGVSDIFQSRTDEDIKEKMEYEFYPFYKKITKLDLLDLRNITSYDYGHERGITQNFPARFLDIRFIQRGNSSTYFEVWTKKNSDDKDTNKYSFEKLHRSQIYANIKDIERLRMFWTDVDEQLQELVDYNEFNLKNIREIIKSAGIYKWIEKSHFINEYNKDI